MTRKTGWFVGGVLLTLFLAAAVVLRLWSLNHFAQIDNRFAGSCVTVKGVAAPRDIQIDPQTRRAFVSSFNDRMMKNERDSVRGAILSINIDDPLEASGWRDRTGGMPAAFKPAGLYFYQDDAVRRLFVANRAAQSVELYDVMADGALVHLESFKERRLTHPNEVVAVGPRAFYVSNGPRYTNGGLFSRWVFFSRTVHGQILHFNGAAWRVAASNLKEPHGLAVEASGAVLYASETQGSALAVFARDVESGLLARVKTIGLPAAPENINIDLSGGLWVGAFPKPLAVLAQRLGAASRSPSQIFYYPTDTGDGKKGNGDRAKAKKAGVARVKPQLMYSSDGNAISAASAAARLDDKLLIGSLVDNKYLICNLPS